MVFLGIDAGNPTLVRRWAAEGHLPNFARALTRGATAEVHHEPGLYVGAVWPTTLTGVGVDRHGCYTGIRPAPFSYDYIAAGPEAEPFWVDVAGSGRRIAVVDPPFFGATPGLDGVQIIEWGCHDRYYGPHSEPPDALDLVVREVGRHPIGMVDHAEGLERYAPCDWMHLTGRTRTADDVAALVDTLGSALAHRERLGKHLLDQGPFDLLVEVVGETHCAGHHLWSAHDPDHPDHDPALLERFGGDPLLDVYRQVDRHLGRHLDAAGDATVFVFLSHGMRSHFDGTLLLDEILWRLDQAYRGAPTPWIGTASARYADLLRRVPAPGRPAMRSLLGPLARRRLAGRAAPSPSTPIPSPAERLWYPLENNTVSGAVRFNRVGREPSGLVGTAMRAHAERWLAEELAQLVNIDTGARVVDEVLASDRLYARRLDDSLPDLLVEWVRDHPIERVWSPTIGVVARPYDGVRTGDHDGRGELIVLGEGIEPGRRPAIRPVDVAPTVAAAAGVFLQGRDGHPVGALIGSSGPRVDRGSAVAESLDRATSAASASTRSYLDESAVLRHELLDLRRRLQGLEAAHHETRQVAAEARAEAGTLRDVLATSAWIRRQPVPEDLTISVVVPTCGRLESLRRAVASVLAQTYRRVEVVVVDDVTRDGTSQWLDALDDDRVRVVRNHERRGEGGSRNAALEVVTGEVVTFLDDDNEFDPDWLRSVAWLFQEHPDTKVVFGARVVDDVERHHGRPGRGMPWFQLNEWDRDLNRQRCLVDVNVLAHRRSDVRFDPDLVIFTDWDYLLGLTAEVDPVRLPCIATYYSTSATDRATDLARPREAEMYARVRERWAGRG